MKPEIREIEVRGYKLLVNSNGEVKLPAKTTVFPFTRLGKTEMRTAVFKERVLKPCIQNSGYLEVSFMHKRKTFKFLVHRLVAMAFVPGYEEGMTVNHINGDKLDNRPDNLEWVSKRENTKHAWANGLVPLYGSDNPGAKLTEKQVRYMRRLMDQGVSAHSLSVIAGVSSSLVEHIRSGRRWAHLK